jgi:hypothetical protein
MSHYAAVLVVPLIVGVLIAVTVLLINGLRERRERRLTALCEARRLDSLDDATLSARADEVFPATVAKKVEGAGLGLTQCSEVCRAAQCSDLDEERGGCGLDVHVHSAGPFGAIELMVSNGRDADRWGRF